MRISDWSSDVCSSDLVVEAIEGQVELAHEAERGFALHRRRLRRIGVLLPRAIEGARPEDVRPRPAEGVPHAHREAQMLFHRLAEDLAVLVVEAIGEDRKSTRLNSSH